MKRLFVEVRETGVTEANQSETGAVEAQQCEAGAAEANSTNGTLI